MPLADSASIRNQARLAKLYSLNLLDTGGSEAFDRLTRLASRVLKAPVSLVSLIDANRSYLKSFVGLIDPWASAREVPLEYAYCQHVVASGKPLVIEDARSHPLVFDSPSITEFSALAYAGMPLVTSDGYALGALCVVDVQPRHWTDEELEILLELSLSAVTEIELQGEMAERRRVETELRENQRFIELVIHSIPDMLYIYDIDERRNIYGNQKMIEHLGYTLEEVATMGASYLPTHLHPEDRERVLKNGLLLRNLADGEILETEYRLLTKDGRYLWLYNRDSVFRRDAQGRMTQFMGIVQDITARRQNDDDLNRLVKRLKTLRRIESELSETLSLDMVLSVSMDAAQRIAGVEHGFIALREGETLNIVHGVGDYAVDMHVPLGRSVNARVLANNASAWIPDVTQDPDYQIIIEGTRALFLLPLISRDRTIGLMRLETRSPDRFTQEAFDFLVLIAGRITIAIDNALLYQTSQEQLQHLNLLYHQVSDLEQLKTDMIRVAAHDLRNPLGVVLGYSQLLLEMEDSTIKAPREWLESIASSASKMKKMVTDILSLERIQAEYNATEPASFDLAALVRGACLEQAAYAQARHQHFEPHLSEQAMWVRGQSVQLREAIDNLIGNAIKYTPDGGTITISLAQADGAPSHARFTVVDTGFGVPADQQDKLFNPFFRATMKEVREIEGTGLGLHLVRNMVERHGGQMRFSSTYGQGSSFGFDIPLIDAV